MRRPETAVSAADIAQAIGSPPPTDEQQSVIEAPLRPLLVVAGAGSGKTETMAARVVWLVANGHVEPDQVLGLTFTRKAAAELSERISRRLRLLRHAGLWTPAPEEDGAEVLGGTPTVSTYHSYAGRLVREHALRLGVEPESRLLSEAAAWQYAAEVVERYDGPMDDVPNAPSTAKSAVVDFAGEIAEHLRTTGEVARYLDAFLEHVEALPAGKGGVAEVTSVVKDLRARRAMLPLVQDYLDLKRSRDSLDFADQVALAAELARRFPDIGAMERQRFRAVLLDEFQDTSEAQLVLLRHLYAATAAPDPSATASGVAPRDHGVGRPDGEGLRATPLPPAPFMSPLPSPPVPSARWVPSVPVTAVGDPHQSIYGWRGASATTLSRFPDDFADDQGPATVLPLTTSWRNDEAILAAANLTSAPLRAGSTVAVQQLRPRPDAASGRVLAGRYLTVEDESAAIAEWVSGHWFTVDGAGPRRHTGVSAAVLCRKRSQFPSVVDALERRGLPVEVVGLGGLLITPEVSDVVALLWVVYDPSRGDHLMRLLTGPAVHLGPADLDGLAEWSRELQRRGGAVRGSGGVRDQAPDTADRASIVEAVEDLPEKEWVAGSGARLSQVARERLASLADVVRGLRALTGMPLADLAAEAERALGLDVEVLARPEHTPTTARAHLDAFADVAATFSTAADRPTLGGFLEWLDAAMDEERGLDKGFIEVSEQAVQVLTVHAAKGLEWDVVAVPGLTEGTFPARPSGVVSTGKTGEWSVSPASDRGWLRGLEGLPYPLRGDRDGLPVLRWESAPDKATLHAEIQRFVQEGGAHQVAEERRLAYVAFTRARRELMITAPVWGPPASPRVVSPFLAELVDRADTRVVVTQWAQMPGTQAKPLNPRDAEPVTAEWPADRLAHRRARLMDATRLVAAELASQAADTAGGPGAAGGLGATWTTAEDREIDLLLAERGRSHDRADVTVRTPAHLSASAVVQLASDQERFTLDLRRPMPQPPATAARRGTAFHAWVEQHYARAAIVDVIDLPGSADDGPGSDADLPMMQQRFLAGPWADRTPVAVELSVETLVSGIPVRGRIDAVFPRADGGFTVVDWKTGRPPSGEEARHRALQLSAYRLAYARLRGLDLDAVDAAFYYAATGETVYPSLGGLEELETVFARIPVEGAARSA